ncbi:MAG: TonB family protein [Chitinophagales bacterium]|nr:TonB family protein [Chitinophagales bacterium]
MNTENKNTKITAEDIEKYFQGKLTPQQMNTLEKAALDDPFLAEAMEGFEAMQGKEWKEQLAMAHSQVALAGTGARVVPLKPKRTAWWKLAVAAVLVIGMGTLLTYVFNGKPAESKESPAQIASADKPRQPARAKSDLDSTTASSSSTVTDASFKPAEKPAGTVAATKEEPAPGNTDDKNIASSQHAVADSVSGAGYSTFKTPPAPEVIGKSAQPPLTALNKQAQPGNGVILQDQQGIVTTREKPVLSEADNQEKARKTAIASQKEKSNPNYFNAQVVSADNSPLPFSNILVKSGNFATYADVKGNFRLFTTDSVLTIEVSSFGFQPRSFTLKSNLPMNKIILLENQQAQPGEFANTQSIRRPSVLSDTSINVEPKDGWKNYNTYVANNIDIPDEALKNEFHGEVELTFDVHANGTISNIRVNKSMGAAIDEAAKKLLMKGPEWKIKKGKKTSASVTVQF